MGALVSFGPRNSGPETLLLKISTSTGHKGRVTNVQWTWPELRQRLSQFEKDRYTLAEFKNLPDIEQARRKNCGFFVGAPFKGGIRKRALMGRRYVLTFDIDQCSPELCRQLDAGEGAFSEYEYVVHSTRKHEAEHPRLRLVMPLRAPMGHDKFEPLSRIMAAKLDPDMITVDPVSWSEAQIMYWPSSCKGAVEVFRHNAGKLLDPDIELLQYGDWKDYGLLPRSARETALHQRTDKAQDPLTKTGPVGAFCRAYTIHQAIEKFLPGVYTPSEMGGDGLPSRYTYSKGSTVNGAIVYDNGTALYSHHGTDPCCNKMVNAFDLFRLHEFGELDNSQEADTPPQNAKSYLAVVARLADDEPVRKELLEGRYTASENAGDAFDDIELPDAPAPAPAPADKASEQAVVAQTKREARAWMEDLDADKNGFIKSTLPNIILLLANDRHLKDAFAFDEFHEKEVVVKPIVVRSLAIALPGRSKVNPVGEVRTEHLIACRHLLEAPVRQGKPGWGIRVADRDLREAHQAVSMRQRVHPVREYLDGLAWDGAARIDRLWLQACHTPDNPYYRDTARLWCIAAVARVYEPGCKFDFAPIVMGLTGLFKSSLVHRLGGQWAGEIDNGFDNAQKFVEASMGVWIGEIPELVQFGKSEVSAIKACISRQFDHVRLPYDPRPRIYQRKSVLIGTTNEFKYLRDKTGNRRFWPVLCGPGQIDLAWVERWRDQLWAEAVVRYQIMRLRKPEGNLPLFLTGEAADIAKVLQGEAMVEDVADDWAGRIGAFLDEPVPASQAALGADPGDPGDALMDEPLVLRNQTCAMEIWEKVYLGRLSDYDQRQAQTISAAMAKVEGWEPGERCHTKRYKRVRTYRRVGWDGL